MGGGGEGSSYDGLYGQAPLERGIFLRLPVYERVGISLVDKKGKSFIWVSKSTQKG